MKKSITALMLCFVSIWIFGQEIKITSNEFPNYQGVVSVERKTASELYTQIKLFIVENFKSANDVIQLDDKESGVLVVKGIIPVTIKIMIGTYTYSMYINFKFETKDGRFRYTAETTSVVDPNAPNAGDMVALINKKPGGKYQMTAKAAITEAVNDFIKVLANSFNEAESTEDW